MASGFDREAPWMLEVQFPVSANVNECMDDSMDNLTGQPGDIKQCWGWDEGDTRILRYSFYEQHRAMAASNRISIKHPALAVDVFDHRYPHG